MDRLTLRDLAIATGGRLREADADIVFHRISTDSRDVGPGAIFWALKGELHDGHEFAADCFTQGAHLCVVSELRAESVIGPALIVNDTLAALGRFADWYRRRFDALIIGVTGSVGKTTTRELVYSALSSQFSGIRSRSNFNNLIGLPLSLLELEPQHEFAVLEMGASRLGDIRELCEIARPEVGIVTAIGPAHLRTFGSLEAIIQTKGELLEQLPSTGFAVLPGDDPVLHQMADRAACPVIFVGQGEDCHVRATNIEVYSHRLDFRCEGSEFSVPVTGRHCLSNALCAIAVGIEIGVPLEQVAEGLTQFQPVPGRCAVTRIGPWTVIDDSYNASPLSVAAACRLLQELIVPNGRHRMLVLGDMCELGDAAGLEHEQIGRLAAQLQLDRLLACGEYADHVAHGASQGGMPLHRIVAASDIATLTTVLDCWLEPNAVILVKGSRATQMERVIDWLKLRAEQEELPRDFESRRHCA